MRRRASAVLALVALALLAVTSISLHSEPADAATLSLTLTDEDGKIAVQVVRADDIFACATLEWWVTFRMGSLRLRPLT